MSSDFRKALTALAVTLVAGTFIDSEVDSARAASDADRVPTVPVSQPDLRVCADPDNLPFSNQRGEGFENHLAAMLAHDLGRKLQYTWHPQGRGFIRKTLDAGSCDVVMGVPADYDMALPTAPYYRSSYVFVTRRDKGLRITSLDDPQLHLLHIGVSPNTPPAHAVAARALQINVGAYNIYRDYSQPDQARALVDAVAHGDVDVAIMWGPIAGYFAAGAPTALELTPVPTPPGQPTWQMTYAISMGVRHQDRQLHAALEAVLARRRPEIERLLASYGVPLLEPDGQIRIVSRKVE